MKLCVKTVLRRWWRVAILFGCLVFNLYFLTTRKSTMPILNMVICVCLFLGGVYCAYYEGKKKECEDAIKSYEVTGGKYGF